MRSFTIGAVLAFAVPVLYSPARADLELPRPSPQARVMQTVGLTEIEVVYASPAVRGRSVWGDLVPYDQIWRTGANANTLIEFSGPVKIGGQAVETGTYSLHSIPARAGWTIILNRKTDGWGSDTYDEKQDVLRTVVTAAPAPARERMTFLFRETTETGTFLDLEWAGLRVTLPIQVETDATADAAIEREMAGLWRAPARAARYLVDQREELDRALALTDRSIALRKTWYNTWLKARILGQQGKKKEAVQLAQEALEMGDDSAGFRFYSGQMKEALKRWGES